METDTQIISRPTLSPLTAVAAVAGAAQGLVQTDVQVVAVVERRCHKMKIRCLRSCSSNVGQGDEFQKSLCDRIDRQPSVLQDIAWDRLPVVGIDQLNSCHSRKVATAFRDGGHEGKSVIGRTAA